MSTNQSNTHTRTKSNKNSKVHETFEDLKDLQKLLSKVSTNTLKGIKDFVVWIYKSIINFFSKCSMLLHFLVILVPISILFIFLIFYIHIKFYDDLFRYNFYKGVKEEFYDYSITEIDDMQSTLQMLIIRENNLDFDNLLFFEIFYNELIDLGVLDDQNYTFPSIANDSETLYKIYQNGSINCEYTIPKKDAEQYMDKRNDSLKELAKIYYYFLPAINYEYKYMGLTINQTFLLAYEFNASNREIIGNESFFAFPRSNYHTKAHNFIVSHRYLNPLVVNKNYTGTPLIDDSYYMENFFEKKDYFFRNNLSITADDANYSFSQMSLSHFNYELNGNITKSILSTLQLYINHNGKNYIINIIATIMEKEIKSNAIKYGAFIYSSDADLIKSKAERFSDNETFLISNQNFIEYTLTDLDEKYFHYGLYDKKYNFQQNGVFFDSFNFDLLADPFKYYSSVDGYNIDLKYLTSLYLYAKIYQNVNRTSYQRKKNDELTLNTFEDSKENIKEICKNINFTQIFEYINSQEEIDCWERQNELYFSDYEQEKLFNIYSLPYCTCLPLYCLKNYQSLENDEYEFSEENFVNKINLPNKCHSKFTYFSNENDEYNISEVIFSLFNSYTKPPENKYLRFQNDPLNQLPGYYLFSISEIHSNASYNFYIFFDSTPKTQLIVIIISFLVVIFSISLVIIYENVKKIIMIINEFKALYEKYIFNSSDTDLITKNIHEKSNKNNTNDDKIFNQNEENENSLSTQNNNNNTLLAELYSNENSLIEKLFVIFCKHYNIKRDELEKYYLKQQHETKYQLRMKMMLEKNELFKLLSMFCVYSPYFRLNLSLDYNAYKYSKLIKKFDKNILEVSNSNQEQIKLTRNILYELISTENILDYGLIMNLNFKYLSNINFENKENCIQNTLFKNVFEKMEEPDNKNDSFKEIILNKEDKQNVKLVLKSKSDLVELFKINFESDDYLNLKKLKSSFNFFLINSYYKYLKQITEENKANNKKKDLK